MFLSVWKIGKKSSCFTVHFVLQFKSRNISERNSKSSVSNVKIWLQQPVLEGTKSYNSNSIQGEFSAHVSWNKATIKITGFLSLSGEQTNNHFKICCFKVNINLSLRQSMFHILFLQVSDIAPKHSIHTKRRERWRGLFHRVTGYGTSFITFTIRGVSMICEVTTE